MVLDYSLLPAYLAIAVTMVLIPGADTLLVVSVGAQRGALEAILVALGICGGSLIYGVLTALGIGALIVSSPTVFAFLLLAGAGYLSYLGFGFLKQAIRAPAVRERTQTPTALGAGFASFRSGLLVNLLNPKIVLFYLALLPQFVTPELGAPGLQMFLLSCILNAIGTIYLVGVGIATGQLQAAHSSPFMGRVLRATGGAYVYRSRFAKFLYGNIRELK
jgi:threonine/homoserine/homoserine lactone efflux protein